MNIFDHKTKKRLDIFYPCVRGLLTYEIYKYLIVGGLCFIINSLIFHISYYYVISTQNVILSKHFQSQLASLCITIPIGFLLNKKYVFFTPKNKSKIQFIFYLLTTLITVVVYTIVLDFLISNLALNATFSFSFTIIIVQFINFFVQKKITFKISS